MGVFLTPEQEATCSLRQQALRNQWLKHTVRAQKPEQLAVLSNYWLRYELMPEHEVRELCLTGPDSNGWFKLTIWFERSPQMRSAFAKIDVLTAENKEEFAAAVNRWWKKHGNLVAPAEKLSLPCSVLPYPLLNGQIGFLRALYYVPHRR